jgi:hypothetical protein
MRSCLLFTTTSGHSGGVTRRVNLADMGSRSGGSRRVARDDGRGPVVSLGERIGTSSASGRSGDGSDPTVLS